MEVPKGPPEAWHYCTVIAHHEQQTAAQVVLLMTPRESITSTPNVSRQSPTNQTP